MGSFPLTLPTSESTVPLFCKSDPAILLLAPRPREILVQAYQETCIEKLLNSNAFSLKKLTSWKQSIDKRISKLWSICPADSISAE